MTSLRSIRFISASFLLSAVSVFADFSEEAVAFVAHHDGVIVCASSEDTALGEGFLADNRPDFDANGQEWRTPPLGGIGLTETVNGHTFFLHDGRARNLAEAILWHGGEAKVSKNIFVNMNKKDRDAVIAFLNSL